jgi:hypothetical protein
MLSLTCESGGIIVVEILSGGDSIPDIMVSDWFCVGMMLRKLLLSRLGIQSIYEQNNQVYRKYLVLFFYGNQPLGLLYFLTGIMKFLSSGIRV